MIIAPADNNYTTKKRYMIHDFPDFLWLSQFLRFLTEYNRFLAREKGAYASDYEVWQRALGMETRANLSDLPVRIYVLYLLE